MSGRHRALVLSSSTPKDRPIPVSDVVWVPVLRLPWRNDNRDRKDRTR